MPNAHAGDRALVRRLLDGQETAFDELFSSYFPRLYRFALVRLSQDHDAAEEIVQTTLARVVTKLATYRGEAALFSWMCTFCRHEIHSLARRRKLSRVDLTEDSPEIRGALESLLAGSEPAPDEAYRRKELGRLVQVTLDHLPPRYGDALEWKYVRGLSVKEIAVLLDVGPKAAESLLGRARHAFRDGFTALAESLGERGPAPLATAGSAS